MRSPTIITFLCALTCLTACGQQEPASEQAANTQPATRSIEVDQATPAPAAEEVNLSSEELLKKGKIVFLRCRSCHTLEEGGMNLTGPNLHGLFGAEAGSKKGYAYSDALRNSNVVWSTETLSAWLESPQTVIEGNVMVFQGLPDRVSRDALIAYLRQNTQ